MNNSRSLLMKILLCLLASLAQAAAISVTLQWDPNAELDLAGYNLKWGFVQGQEDHVIDVGNNITATVDEPWSVGMTIYFVVTAYNVVDMESDPSNEVSYTVPHGRPRPPFNLRIIDVTK